MARHRRAALATRAGAVALGGGLEPYVYEERDAAPVATTLAGCRRGWRPQPGGPRAGDGPDACRWRPGGGALAKEMIRVNHYGPDATPGAVQNSLAALGPRSRSRAAGGPGRRPPGPRSWPGGSQPGTHGKRPAHLTRAVFTS